jgi:hypothetical protein
MDIPDHMMTRAVILDRHTRVILATCESWMNLICYQRGKSNTFDQSDLTSYEFLSRTSVCPDDSALNHKLVLWIQ